MNEFLVKHGLISKGNITTDYAVSASQGFYGTSSWANNTVNSDNAITSSYSLYTSNALSSSYSLSSSYALSASKALSSSYSNNSTYAITAGIANGLSYQPSTSSYSLKAGSASFSTYASSAYNATNSNNSLLGNWVSDNSYFVSIEDSGYTSFGTRFDFTPGTTFVFLNGIYQTPDNNGTWYDYAESGSRAIVLHKSCSVDSRISIRYMRL